VRALSPILRRERVLQGVEITEILREADEGHWSHRDCSLTRKPGPERHSQHSGPWYEVPTTAASSFTPTRTTFEPSRSRPRTGGRCSSAARGAWFG